MSLFGSDTIEAIEEVARGDVHLATINPSSPLTMAYRGRGPFKEAIPVRAIAVIPTQDQFAFAVSEKTGLKSFMDLLERRYPLRVSLRGQKRHSVHLVVKEVLAQVGFTLDDLVSWDGQVRYDEGMQDGPNRFGAVQRGEVDAIFDEAVKRWTNQALDAGMRFLPLEEEHITRLEEIGFRRAILSKDIYPKLLADVSTVDFSGWPIFTHADVSEDIVRSFCLALDNRKDRIPWQGEGPLPLERMCEDNPEGPLDVPLHPAAEIFWRERGYLK
ncbi:MAG: hypothetical protein EXR70_13745 [Deltaproteobacteria bacterium]|nr:hypothetical protein [Deltaproteobacteria bacterium]